ncbi:MAG: SMI1/KNR4 family protein [Saprospiraceae bacterium]
MKYKTLQEPEKSIFRKALVLDSEKGFDEEFNRTTNLEKRLIDEFGFAGIQLIFENRNSANYFALGDFPITCPWAKFNDQPIQAFLESNFSLVQQRLPMLLAAMQERCKFIFAEQKNSEVWQLHYLMEGKLYDQRDYYRIYTGGMPIAEAKANASLLKFGWTLPADLKEFYMIHNGFGEINDAGCILNQEQLVIKGEMMNPICRELNTRPEDYRYDNLLEFFPDGAGNAQCFLRKETGNTTTVDWDHETWEISGEESFYSFVDERLAQMDEE